MNNDIEVTGLNLVELIRKAYDLSVPNEIGEKHFEEGELPADEAAALVNLGANEVVDICYLKGRMVNLLVRKDQDSRLWMLRTWFGHTDAQLAELAAHVGATL